MGKDISGQRWVRGRMYSFDEDNRWSSLDDTLHESQRQASRIADGSPPCGRARLVARNYNNIMKILFRHGWQSVPGGVKPTFLAQHGHTVINPKLPDEDFAEAVKIAQTEFDRHQPDV